MGEVLGAVAYSQKGIFPFDPVQVDLGSVFVPHGTWAAGQDDSLDGRVKVGNLIEREDLAVNVQFTQTPADQLGDL